MNRKSTYIRFIVEIVVDAKSCLKVYRIDYQCIWQLSNSEQDPYMLNKLNTSNSRDQDLYINTEFKYLLSYLQSWTDFRWCRDMFTLICGSSQPIRSQAAGFKHSSNSAADKNSLLILTL